MVAPCNAEPRSAEYFADISLHQHLQAIPDQQAQPIVLRPHLCLFSATIALHHAFPFFQKQDPLRLVNRRELGEVTERDAEALQVTVYGPRVTSV